MSYAEVEMKVIQWSEARKIIPNSTPIAQWKKGMEEMEELRDAIVANDLAMAIDGVGDTVVCLINICALLDISLTECLKVAYEEIKDRSGTMGSDGIFYKDK
jgi:NTP pyrophosphatase (non-canonical NTP hydrolase)